MRNQEVNFMPNIKSAKKRCRVIKTKTEQNKMIKTSVKTAIKKVERAVANNDKDAANAALKTAIKSIDKATKNGVSSKNKSARNKARLTKKVNTME